MWRRFLSSVFVLLILVRVSTAQYDRALPPIADPADKRFVGVKEDWTSPALNASSLRAVQTMRGYIHEYPSCTVELSRAQWRWGDPIDIYIVKPTGVKKPRVILYLYSYPTDTDMFQNEDWEKNATRDGFAAVGIVSALTGQRYHDRPMKEWFLSELQETLATTAHDVQMLINYLETRDDLDTSRIGMFAQGSGASIAILASAADPRIKVLDVMDPWGDWPTWIATSPFVPKDERADYLKPEFLKNAGVLDPVDWLPKVQARKFQVEQNGFDKITPQEAKDKLRAAVPTSASVVVYKTVKDLDSAHAADTNVGWIKREIPALPDATAASSSTVGSAGSSR